MKKKRNLLFVLLVLILCVSLVLSFAACKEKEPTDDGDTEASDLLLSNGDFTKVDSETFPKKPANWSGSAGAASGSNVTPSDSKSVVSGVIDTTASVYDKNKKLWGKIANPATKGEDANVLMIYNAVSTVYQYTMSSVSVAQNKYYKISFWLKTVNVEGGAYIYVGGDAYTRFENLNTNGNWQKYALFIEGGAVKSGTISLTVALGQGDMSMSPAKGYAFFDNIVMEEQTEEQYAAASDAEATTHKYSMKLPDSEFENTTPTASQPYSASAGYTAQTSKGADGTSAPSSSTDVKSGILDLDKSLTGVGNVDGLEQAPGASGNRLLYIDNISKTAYGFRSKAQIRFESNAYTKITVYVRTVLDDVKNDADGNNGKGAGATIRLTTGADDDSNEIQITNIDTEGRWQPVSFIVESNKLRSRDLYIEFWLGQGGKTDYNLLTKGSVFFDRMTMETVDKTAYDAVDANDKFTAAKSLVTSPDDVVTLSNGNFTNGLKYWKNMPIEDVAATLSTANVVDVKNADFKTVYGYDNPLAPGADIQNVLAIVNKNLTAAKIRYNPTDTTNAVGSVTALPNTYYRMSLWVKTVNVDEAKGVNVDLLAYDKEIKDAEDYFDKYVSEKSVTNINSENFDSATDVNNNRYVEVVFYIEGSELENKNVTIEISFGTGTRYEAGKLVSGMAFVSNLTMEKITPSEYSSATTGTTAQKVSFISGEKGSVTNGGFSKVGVQDTLDRYENEGYKDADAPAFDSATGLLKNAFGAPKSWTPTDKNILSNMYAGVFNTASSEQKTALGLSDNNSFFNGYTDADEEEKKNVLALKTKPQSDSGYLKVPTSPSVCGCDCKSCIDKGYCDGTTCDNTGTNDASGGACGCLHKKFGGFLSEPTGYTSPNFSLTKDGYFVASIWARVETGTTASVKLKAANSLDKVITITGDGMWHKYSFYIETGLADISASLVVCLGDSNPDNPDTSVSGTAFFDWASFASLTKEQFDYCLTHLDAAREADHKYTTDSFDNVSSPSDDDSLGVPADWKLSALDDTAPKEADSLMAGIYDRTTDNKDLLAKDDQTPFPDSVYNLVFDANASHDRVLVINQRKKTAYSATNSASKSLAVDSYYKITLEVFTWGLGEGNSAKITVKLNNKSYSFGSEESKINTSGYENGVEIPGGWKTYTYYIRTAPETSISNVYISFSLGAKDEANWQEGMLFVDNVSTDKITEEEFKAGAPVVTSDDTIEGDVTEIKYNKSEVYRIVFTEKDINAEEPVEEPTDGGNGLLWLYITTGVIGGLIIIVVIVFFFRKYYKPKKRNAKKLAPYDANKNKSSKNAVRHKDDFKD